MAALKKPASKRRGKAGNWFAVLLLPVVLGGLGWFWTQQKAPQKQLPPTTPPPAVVTKKDISPLLAVPVVKVIPASPPLATNQPIPAPIIPPVPSVAPPVTNIEPTKPRPSMPVITATDFPRPARTTLEAQIALARRAISPGSIDGLIGLQTRAALMAFQRAENLPVTGVLETNAPLLLEAPLLADYLVTTNDLARLQPLGKTWLAKSQQSALDYETLLELVAEKAHAHPRLLQQLNPALNWEAVTAGTLIKIPDVSYPKPPTKAAFVVIRLSEKALEAFDAETNLLLHCPCSIAARVEKRPVGRLQVAVVAQHPNYTFDPAVFPESPEAQAIGHKIILPPGPNNPVGVAWIGLDKPGYGMHGTPVPEQVGRTESHGCFRLANWDAEYLLKLVWIGLPVEVLP